MTTKDKVQPWSSWPQTDQHISQSTQYSQKIPSSSSIALQHDDVIMSTLASQITSLTIVYSTVYSGADQRKHQSSTSLAFVRGIHRWWVNSPHKGPVTRKMFPSDDVIMIMGVRYGSLCKFEALSMSDIHHCDAMCSIIVYLTSHNDPCAHSLYVTEHGKKTLRSKS